ncbi:MAG TPA: NUDIX domain-containing protein [Gemmatimonadaceae bacterium]|nr:NUDIX domain-containing protein [Gemmatimonadaceae bacterium]
MIEARVATVDVYPLRRQGDTWQTLVLQRAPNTRCTFAWEAVHGHIENGERPEDAAIREVAEETGLAIARLYNVTVQPFYLHTLNVVTLAVAFAGVVDDGPIRLSEEHARAEWVSIDEATARYAWPRSAAALREAVYLLRSGNGGFVDDVLRVR